MPKSGRLFVALFSRPPPLNQSYATYPSDLRCGSALAAAAAARPREWSSAAWGGAGSGTPAGLGAHDWPGHAAAMAPGSPCTHMCAGDVGLLCMPHWPGAVRLLPGQQTAWSRTLNMTGLPTPCPGGLQQLQPAWGCAASSQLVFLVAWVVQCGAALRCGGGAHGGKWGALRDLWAVCPLGARCVFVQSRLSRGSSACQEGLGCFALSCVACQLLMCSAFTVGTGNRCSSDGGMVVVFVVQHVFLMPPRGWCGRTADRLRRRHTVQDHFACDW